MAADPSLSRRDFLAQCAAAMAAGPAALRAAERKPQPKTTRASPLAMWALTGTLKSDDVRRQLDAFHAAGWGVVLYPRWGLELEYLGEAWFERIRFIVEQAAARKMEVWLYDEFTWPSGHAKGLVTQGHEHLEAQLLHVERDGRSRIERVAGSANLLDAEATRRFLQVTHDRYAAAVGKFFGSTVRAIFTDEPSLELQHRGRPKGETSWRLAWSAAMEAALGGDFRQRITSVGGDVAHSPLWRDYWAAYTRIFHDVWVAPIARWCEAHKIAFTGHLLGEHSFGTQVAYNGCLRRQLGAFGIPGIDEISTRTEVARCEAMTLAAIAEFAGRERMAEVYALGPPTMTLGTMRRMVELCAACGVDRYVLGMCPQDFRGGIHKREYFGVYGPQQPWFRECARIYTDFVAEAAERARAAKPLGVPWPSDEELWTAAGPEPTKSPSLKAMSEKFIAAAREAIRARLEPGAAAPPALATRKRMEAAWTFAPKGLNSIRLDQPTLTVVELPRTAELSVQSQLVRGLRINGVAVNLDAAPADRHFDLSYRRVSVARLFRVGENRIEVDSTEPKPLKFLPALVLWGSFAVDTQGRLIAPPKTLIPGDWRAQGYPAFCGTGRYRTTVTLDTISKSLCVDSGGYPARAIVNGRNLGVRAWTPFVFDLRGAARAGRNDIIIEIASTLGHLVTPAEAPPVGLLAAWFES
ncbi:MAG: twin-arginine translocation signal domain-containing protein [Verrucomicrobia bacterium]|nr:twin-arginine translocation signal domain-containing protein [Verrucomicrobiota bacterium]